VTDSGVSPTPFEQLKQSLCEDWPAISKAREATKPQASILNSICDNEEVALPANAVVVCFGSLARGEWTSGSDVDWTLLIDGMSDPDHFRAVQRIGQAFEDASLQKPGATGTFGQITSSHELIHHVGGTGDTNQNLTRRMLLLLESTGFPDAVVHERVIHAVLERYIVCDPAVSSLGTPEWRVPRFLLNDVVRYWRTIAVDYATKKWESPGLGWALRNIKLRMSRKLLFTKGMLLCFYCENGIHDGVDPADGHGVLKGIARRCFELARMSPMDLLCKALHEHGDLSATRRILNSYDEFLNTLDAPDKRAELKKLDSSTAVSNKLFLQMRDLSHEYSEGLEELFFDSDGFKSLTRKYGVF
jgi:predicted nucleotidyltransferase